MLLSGSIRRISNLFIFYIFNRKMRCLYCTLRLLSLVLFLLILKSFDLYSYYSPIFSSCDTVYRPVTKGFCVEPCDYDGYGISAWVLLNTRITGGRT